MKDWQKGIELDELLKLEKTWEGYNERCLSPFLEMKKNKIANSIDLTNINLAISGLYRVGYSKLNQKSICILHIRYLLLQ